MERLAVSQQDRKQRVGVDRRALMMVISFVVSVAAVPAADAAPRWAPESEATIRPGARMTVGGTECTANFVFYDARSIYLGQSARCEPTGATFSSHVCPSGGLPPGTKVDIQGASHPGVVVYNSWVTMLRRNPGLTSCGGNDFALVRLHEADERKVNPTVPFWGGPSASKAESSLGQPLYSYGRYPSGATGTVLQPKPGVDTTALVFTAPWGGFRPGGTNRGWTHFMTAGTPGIGSDIGSAVLDARGGAFGVLNVWAHDLSNRVTDLSKVLRYMKAHTRLDAVRLAIGTRPFGAQP